MHYLLVSADPPAGQICRVPEGGLSAVSSCCVFRVDHEHCTSGIQKCIRCAGLQDQEYMKSTTETPLGIGSDRKIYCIAAAHIRLAAAGERPVCSAPA